MLAAFSIIANSVSLALAMDRASCEQSVMDLLKKDSNYSRPHPQYFFGAEGGDALNPVLTLDGCLVLCEDGPANLWYPDIGQRYMVFLLPIVALLFNMDVSPLDKAKYYEIFNLLGNPIGCFEAMLAKVKVWDWCARADEHICEALGYSDNEAKGLGTVLAMIEDILGPSFDPVKVLEALTINRLPAQPPLSNHDQEWLRGQSLIAVIREAVLNAAYEVVDGRTNDIWRTYGGLVFYSLSVIAAFVTVVGGGNNSPPGGRIATALLLSWLIPAVLLSNFIGGYVSRRTTLRAMKRMVTTIDDCIIETPRRPSAQNEVGLLQLRGILASPDVLLGNQRWNGGSDLYRPDSVASFDPSPRKWIIRLVSTVPVFISFAFGFPILWLQPPQGLNCRSFLLIGITSLWLVSAAISWGTWSYMPWFRDTVNRHWHWRLTLLKDTIFGLGCLVMIFLSSAGLFNTCWCWSERLYYHDQAHVPLNIDGIYVTLEAKNYPMLASVCIVLEGLSFVLMYFGLRKGFKLFRWSEVEITKEFIDQAGASLKPKRPFLFRMLLRYH